MMHKKWVKISTILIASSYCTLLIQLITFLVKIYKGQLNYETINNPLFFIVPIFFLGIFIYLTTKKNNKIALKISFISILSILLLAMFVYVDDHFTYKSEFSNTLYNIVGLSSYHSKLENYQYQIFGLAIVIYPILLFISYLLVIFSFKKYNK